MLSLKVCSLSSRTCGSLLTVFLPRKQQIQKRFWWVVAWRQAPSSSRRQPVLNAPDWACIFPPGRSNGCGVPGLGPGMLLPFFSTAQIPPCGMVTPLLKNRQEWTVSPRLLLLLWCRKIWWSVLNSLKLLRLGTIPLENLLAVSVYYCSYTGCVLKLWDRDFSVLFKLFITRDIFLLAGFTLYM